MVANAARRSYSLDRTLGAIATLLALMINWAGWGVRATGDSGYANLRGGVDACGGRRADDARLGTVGGFKLVGP